MLHYLQRYSKSCVLTTIRANLVKSSVTKFEYKTDLNISGTREDRDTAKRKMPSPFSNKHLLLIAVEFISCIIKVEIGMCF